MRTGILEALTMTGPMSAEDLVAQSGSPLVEIERHVAVLEECGAVERVSSEHDGDVRFEATMRSLVFSDDEWARFPLRVRRVLFANDLRRIGDHAWSAFAAGGFDRPDVHVSWTPMRLDASLHRRTADLLGETLERALAIQADADHRESTGRLGGEVIESEVVMLHFDRVRPASHPGAEEESALSFADEESLQHVYALSEQLAEEVASPTPDWRRVAATAFRIAATAQRHSAAERVEHG